MVFSITHPDLFNIMDLEIIWGIAGNGKELTSNSSDDKKCLLDLIVGY